MHILFSFCNTIRGTDFLLDNSLSPLAVLDTETKKVMFIETPRGLNANGITGLTNHKGFIFALSQLEKPPTIIKINKKDPTDIRIKELKEVKDPHSICIHKENLLICSTATNSIEKYSTNLKYLGCYWQHPKTGRNKDKVHLNSVFLKNGEIYATCFGRKKDKKWSSAKKGYLINTSNNKKKWEITHPHSATAHKGDIYYLSSMKGIVYKNGQVLVRVKDTYLRGLFVNDKYIVVGISSGRKRSKSTGLINNPQEEGKFLSKTGILLIDRKSKERRFFDLSMFEKEIYDVLILEENELKLPEGIVGLSKINEKKVQKENVLLTEIYQAKEEVEERLKKKLGYIDYLENSRFFGLFEKIRRLENRFLGEKDENNE